MMLYKVLAIFIFKIRSEDVLAHIVKDFLLRPEPTTSKFFLARLHLAIIYTTMHIHQLFLSLALKDVMSQRLGLKVGDAQFFSHLSVQGLVHTLA